MGQKERVEYLRDSHWDDRRGEGIIQISSGPVKDKSVP